MKLSFQPNRARGFFATVVMIAILGIMLIFVMANAKRLYQLHQELKLVERQQMKKFTVQIASTNLSTATTVTNRPPATPP